MGYATLMSVARQRAAARCRRLRRSTSPRYLRTCDAFITEWARHGYGQLDEPAAVLAALQRVLSGAERFPRDLFVAARRFQKVRTECGH